LTWFRKTITIVLFIKELTHALGFLPVDLSGAFVNEDDIRYGSDNVIMIENQVNSLTQVEKSYKKVITPKVTALARLHYNCPDFLGLPLEDAGSDATSGYHWDMMAVGHEIMAGSILYDSEITSLTLAMLEGSQLSFLPHFVRGNSNLYFIGRYGLVCSSIPKR
jgi:hypothetical protein